MRDENAQRSELPAPVKNNDIKLKGRRRLKDERLRSRLGEQPAWKKTLGGLPRCRRGRTSPPPAPGLADALFICTRAEGFFKKNLPPPAVRAPASVLRFNPSGRGSGAGPALQSSFISRLRLSLWRRHRWVKFRFRQSIRGFPESLKCFSSLKS